MSFSKLDADRIVNEALALLAQEGLAQVGIRRLAQRLGVSASSLYWHVQDRDALLGLMSAHVFDRCVARVAPAADWAGWLRNFGLEVWDTQQALRDSSQLILTARSDREGRRAVREGLETHLTALGLSPDQAPLVLMAVQSLATGWTTMQSRMVEQPDDARRRFATALDALISGFAGANCAAGAARIEFGHGLKQRGGDGGF